FVFFFFQAEDGIRDGHVTGVQTCALPISNKILRAFLKSKGVADKDIDEKYTPFGHADYQTIVADIKKFSAGGKTAVVSTINGDRSEERRVGKEWRSRRAQERYKKDVQHGV